MDEWRPVIWTNLRPDIQTNGGRIFGRPEAGYSDERGQTFGRTEAKYLFKQRPEIRMNGGRIFRQTAAGYSDDLRPDIQTNGARH